MLRSHLMIPFALLLCMGLACSDDTDSSKDQGVADDKGKTADDKGKTADDKGTTADDKGTTADDKGTTADDKGTTADDKGPTGDTSGGSQFFTFKGKNYPITPSAVYCTVVSKMYNIRTGSKAGGTGKQANVYAYFAAPGPPAAGTYTLLGQGLTPPGAGESRLMVVDFTDNSFWYSKKGGTITVTHVGGKPQVSWTNKTLADQLDNTKTTTSSCLMKCK